MKLLIQKVKNLKIYQKGEKLFDFSKEDFLLLIYVALEKGDENKNLEEIVNFLENCQILDFKEKFSKSIKEIKPILVFVSQITLTAEFDKSGRINFNQALDFNLAKKVFDKFIQKWQNLGYNIYHTEFGSNLKIESLNLGPVNFLLEK